ncbi:MAG: (4Fe-4S)-binding protein [Desulfatitalea sp. BRH_c12]|nr:MAG: (4Fe-4S)-binding protein [Desulfatitalea sp. BRH_c12]
MHEILIISGKGGTGKTSLTAAFAHLSERAVLCDLDVDAPDLHLILRPAPTTPTPFVSGSAAHIDAQKCTQCGTCAEMCQFKAVRCNGASYAVDPIRCEGCGVCVHFCPEKAIESVPRQCGHWSVADTRFGPLVHAQLYPGEENSGKLVALLRREAKALAEKTGAGTILSDGPPGIGCPVISALSGISRALIVTEPTPSGLHDLERIVALCEHFRVPVAGLINKCDLNADFAGRIRAFCQGRQMPILAELPHHVDFVHAMVRGQAITEYADGAVAQQLRKAWELLIR